MVAGSMVHSPITGPLWQDAEKSASGGAQHGKFSMYPVIHQLFSRPAPSFLAAMSAPSRVPSVAVPRVTEPAQTESLPRPCVRSLS